MRHDPPAPVSHPSRYPFAIVVACLLALGTAACAPDAPLQDRFQARLDQLRQESGFPGATAAYLLADGTLSVHSTGMADPAAGIAMPANAVMPAGSIGKSFVAALALALAREGLLDLDGLIEQWLGNEAWFADVPSGSGITLRHLLTHSSGLRHHYDDPDIGAVIAAGRSSGDPDWHLSPAEAVAIVSNDASLFPPGQGFAYTDTGYILVGLIIEKVTSGTVYDEVRKRFLDPLELTLTSPSDRRDIGGLVPGHIGDDNPLALPSPTAENGVMRFSPASEWTGGGLASNPGDLVRWAKALYEGSALGPGSVDALLASVPWGDAEGVRYGLGVIISETALGTRYGHSGWFPGYVSDVRYYPDHGVAIAIQVNSDADQATGAWVTVLAEEVLR